MVARARFYKHAKTVVDQTETITLSFDVPYNCVLEQIFFRIGNAAVAQSAQAFQLEKTNATGFAFDLWIIDPFETGGQQWVEGGWECRKGDTINFNFGNAENQDSWLEMIFKEAD